MWRGSTTSTDDTEKTCAIKEELEVTFNFRESIDILNPYYDALVISLGIANCLIKRILVENRSSVNIIFADTLNEMQMEETKITRQAMMLIGFSGDIKHTVGEIELPVGADDVKKYTKFWLLEDSSSFNAILGRPRLHEIRTVPFTYHQVIKFPTESGVRPI